MKRSILYISSFLLLTGLLLIALSYTTLLSAGSVWGNILREIGVALTIAAIIAASVDQFFQSHLVHETKQAAEAAAKILTKDINELSNTISKIHEESIQVMEKVPIMSCCLKSGISDIYNNRSDPAAESRISELLSKSTQQVDIMGISLRTFFQGGGKVNTTVSDIMALSSKNKHVAAWRVLVIDPECEQAKLRSEREELPGTQYEKSNLFREVTNSIEIIDTRYIQSGAKILLHTYRGAPSCFLLRIDDVMFVEQYHYGRQRGQRAAELVPLIEFKSDCTTFLELEGHFKYMWESLSRDPYKSKNI